MVRKPASPWRQMPRPRSCPIQDGRHRSRLGRLVVRDLVYKQAFRTHSIRRPVQQNTKVGQSNKQDATAMMAQQDNRHECADLHGKPINRVGKCLVAVLISVLRSNPSPDS